MGRRRKKTSETELQLILVLIGAGFILYIALSIGVATFFGLCILSGIGYFIWKAPKKQPKEEENKIPEEQSSVSANNVSDQTRKRYVISHIAEYVLMDEQQEVPVPRQVEQVTRTDVQKLSENLPDDRNPPSKIPDDETTLPVTNLAPSVAVIQPDRGVRTELTNSGVNGRNDTDDLVSLKPTLPSRYVEEPFAIPPPPEPKVTATAPVIKQPEDPYFVLKKNEVLSIRPYKITGVLLLVATAHYNHSQHGVIAGLIDPARTITPNDDWYSSTMPYWPFYITISPSSRGAYLGWLTNGANDPDADIGYVFLYLYGLERLFFDLLPNLSSERPLAQEVLSEAHRLREIYADKNKSFKRYIYAFVEVVEAALNYKDLFTNVPPVVYSPKKPYQLPLSIQLWIGKAIRDEASLDFAAVRQWIDYDPTLWAGKARLRHGELYWTVLNIDFHFLFPRGLSIPDNESRLCVEFNTASPPWNSGKPLLVEFDSVPDIKTYKWPQSSFKTLVLHVEALFEKYESKFVSQKWVNAVDLQPASYDQNLLALPFRYWPDEIRQNLDFFAQQCKHQPTFIVVQQFLELFGTEIKVTNHIFRNTIEYLATQHHIDIAPSIEELRVIPSSTDTILFYPCTDGNAKGSEFVDESVEPHQAFRNANVAIELGSLVAHSDKEFCDFEVAFMNAQIDSWKHLTGRERAYLQAKVLYLQRHPSSLQRASKKLTGLEPTAIDAICLFMINLVHVDGIVSSSEVAYLDRVYAKFGRTPEQVRLDLSRYGISSADSAPQVMASTDAPVVEQDVPHVSKPSITLDTKRIAELRAESHEIGLLLGAIFDSDHSTAASEELEHNPSSANPAPSADSSSDKLIGLDAAHSKLLQELTAKETWSKAEVTQIAMNLSLMVNSALDTINDAAFEQFDAPLVEGDDPIEINLDLLESLIK